MTEFVVIRLHAADTAVDWVLVDSNGTRQSGVSTGTLEDAARDGSERSVIVLVPATDVLTTRVQIPVRSTAKIRAALPFALEEMLAEDIDTLHFAPGLRPDDGQVPVAIVSHDAMRAWLERLTEAGIDAVRLVPENQGLAMIPGTMSLLLDDDCILFNDGAGSEFVMQGVRPSDLLVAAGKLGDDEPSPSTENSDGEEAASGKHLLAFCTPELEDKYTHDWNALRHEMHSVDVNVLPDGVLPKLAVTVASGNGINLLQAPYGKKSEYSSYLRPWRIAAALLLGFFVLTFTAKGVDYYRLSEERNSLQQQFSAVYRAARPGDTREVADPSGTLASIRNQLGGVSATPVFLPSLKTLGSALAANTEAGVEAISYRAGVIDVRLTAPDITTLDSIQQAVSDSGRFNATIASTEKVADRTNGRIQIRESGQ